MYTLPISFFGYDKCIIIVDNCGCLDLRGIISENKGMIRNIIKFATGGIIIVVLGAGALFGIDYLRYRTSSDYRALQEVKRIEKEIAEDPYGGDTPEETLRLFIDALKKGDTDLAAKYFVYGEQEEWREDLATMEEKKLLPLFIKDVEALDNRYPLVEGRSDRFIFETYNEQKELVLQADLRKESNGKWKIQDL